MPSSSVTNAAEMLMTADNRRFRMGKTLLGICPHGT
jgi:hypothetical protein